MKNLLSKIVAGLILTSLLTGSACAQGKIATVDLRKAFDNYWKRKQADAAIKDRAAEMEKQHTEMLNDYKKAKEQYNNLLTGANDSAVSSDERDKRKKSAEDKLKQTKDMEDTIIQYEKSSKSSIEEQITRMRLSIIGEIRTIINAKAQAAGYALVLDSSAETPLQIPFVLYSNNKDNDLTDAVLAQLNAAAPPDLLKTDDKKDEKKK